MRETGRSVLELKVTAGPLNRYSSGRRLWKWDGQSNPGCVLGRLSLVLLFHHETTCLPGRWMARGKFPVQETDGPNQNSSLEKRNLCVLKFPLVSSSPS